MFTPRADESAIDFIGRVRIGPLLVGAALPLVGGGAEGSYPLGATFVVEGDAAA